MHVQSLHCIFAVLVDVAVVVAINRTLRKEKRMAKRLCVHGKRDKAIIITCVLCRDLHFTLIFSDHF